MKDYNEKRITIKILRKLNQDVESFVKSDKGKRYSNSTEFISEAIRDLLKDYEKKKK